MEDYARVMSVELVILGKYSPFAPANGACPGYWVTPGSAGDAGAGVLLDCGPGVLARFQESVGPLRLIPSVILSHLHFDHTSDILALRYAVSPDGRYRELPNAVTVYSPDEPEREFSLLGYKESMIARTIEAGKDIEVGGLRASFFPGQHSIPSYAVRLEGPSGVLAYSGDSRPCDSLVQAASNADLFLCEASAVEADAAFAAPGHLTARQAGEVAAEARVKKLLLTHLWPLYDERQILSECRAVFPHAEIAKEGARYRVRP